VIAPAEASSNLARYDGVRYGPRFNGAADLRSCIARRAARGSDRRCGAAFWWYLLLSAGYLRTPTTGEQQMRALIRPGLPERFRSPASTSCLRPPSPVRPSKAGEKLADPIAMYMSDIFTVTANLAGLPAIPCRSDGQKDYRSAAS